MRSSSARSVCGGQFLIFAPAITRRDGTKVAPGGKAGCNSGHLSSQARFRTGEKVYSTSSR
jgi:hypothetical protein